VDGYIRHYLRGRVDLIHTPAYGLEQGYPRTRTCRLHECHAIGRIPEGRVLLEIDLRRALKRLPPGQRRCLLQRMAGAFYSEMGTTAAAHQVEIARQKLHTLLAT
jgi:hypothetical protein